MEVIIGDARVRTQVIGRGGAVMSRGRSAGGWAAAVSGWEAGMLVPWKKREGCGSADPHPFVCLWPTCALLPDAVNIRGNNQADDRHQLDQNIHRRARRVFEGIAYGVACHRGFVGLGAFKYHLAVDQHAFFK